MDIGMATTTSRPALRSVESIVANDRRHGRVIVLRDTQGVTDKQAVIPEALFPIVGSFDGARTCAQIAADLSKQFGETVPVEAIVRLATELEKAFFLEGDAFEAAKKKIEDEFANSEVREASHAGGAYHEDPKRLRTYLDDDCLARGKPNGEKRIVGLVAPHIDPWRGAACYGHAYASLRRALPAEADTFLLLGTSHAYMRRPFALCRKAFDTPLGRVEADTDSIDALAKAAKFDAYADQFNHKREHSLEFQAVFLKHLLGERPFRIIPVLASMGSHQARGSDPACEATSETESLELATLHDARAFWKHVASDLETRRVCGLGPIYSLLRALPDGVRGRTIHYEQTVDADDGSIVSHAAVGFFA
jgi:predicted class III extradiol MEMO1 family dioxygenase